MGITRHLLAFSFISLLGISAGSAASALELPATQPSPTEDTSLTIVFGIGGEFETLLSDIQVTSPTELPAQSAPLPDSFDEIGTAKFDTPVDRNTVRNPSVIVELAILPFDPEAITIEGEAPAPGSVPEPSTFLMMALGLLGLARFARKR